MTARIAAEVLAEALLAVLAVADSADEMAVESEPGTAALLRTQAMARRMAVSEIANRTGVELFGGLDP